MHAGNLPKHSESSRPTPLDSRANWFLKITVATWLLLLLLTWKLWIPGSSSFPIIPFWKRPLLNKPAVTVAGCAVLLGALIGLLLTRRKSILAWFTSAIIVAMALLCAQSQQRLQPWCLHLCAVVAVICTCRHQYASLVRWITISIYFHSALSKLDHSFLFDYGGTLLDALIRTIGLQNALLSPTLRGAVIVGFPLVELLATVLLLGQRGRRYGWMLAAAMHTALLATLGPAGLNHDWPVLVWNGFFLIQSLWFLWGPMNEPAGEHDRQRPRRHFMNVAVTAFCLLPVLNWEVFDWYDNWPAWSLYSSRGERVYVEVHHSAISDLPPTARKHIIPARAMSDWHQVRIDRWSIAELGVPLYPEDRFMIGVSLGLATHLKSDDSIRIHLKSRAARFTGKRTSELITGTETIREFCRRSFVLKAFPIR